MPQQEEAMGTTRSPGMPASSATAGVKAAKAFWWQCPCTCAAAATGFSASFGFSRARNSPISTARPASAAASAPGSRERNSSRRVSRQDGSIPTTGRSKAESAARVRAASARAAPTMPAAK